MPLQWSRLKVNGVVRAPLGVMPWTCTHVHSSLQTVGLCFVWNLTTHLFTKGDPTTNQEYKTLDDISVAHWNTQASPSQGDNQWRGRPPTHN